MDDAIEILGAAQNTGVIIRDCDFLQAATSVVFSACIDSASTTDGLVTVLRCYFPVGSDALEAAEQADFMVAENYLMQGAASVGGTLVLGT